MALELGLGFGNVEVLNAVAGYLAGTITSESVQWHAFVGVLLTAVTAGNDSHVGRQGARGVAGVVNRPVVEAATGTITFALGVATVGVKGVAIRVG